MNTSAILVQSAPQYFAGVVDALQALPGVEVHHRDESTGRMIVIQEAETVSAEVDGLKTIKALPHVGLAELVFHHFEDDPDMDTDLPKQLDDLEGLEFARVPDPLLDQ